MKEGIKLGKGAIKEGVKIGQGYLNSRIGKVRGRAIKKRKMNVDRGVSNVNTLTTGSYAEHKCCDYIYNNGSSYAAPPLSTVTGLDGFYSAPGVGGMTCVNRIIQNGTNVATRIGNKVRMNMMVIDFDMEAFGQCNHGICALIYDRQPNGAYPTVTDMFACNNGSSLTTPPYAGLNINNKARYHIIRKKVIRVGTEDEQVKHIKWVIKKPMDTIYNGSTPAIGDITTGAIYLIQASVDYNAGSYYIIYTNTVVRMRYYDA